MPTAYLTETDAALLARLETDPDQAMETLIEKYSPLVCHVAAKYLPNPEDVKDCVNDTFTAVYLHRAAFSPQKGSLAVWIGTIARNQAISMYRKCRKDLSFFENGAGAESVPDTHNGMEEKEQALDIERALSELNEADRQIIRMKYYGGMSTREIATALMLPYETVKKRHARTLKRLRLLLLSILVAAILFLAACGVIHVLRHLGVLPGYGVVDDPEILCYLMLKRPSAAEQEDYTARLTSARVYNGVLSIKYRVEVLDPSVTEDLTGDALLNVYQSFTPRIYTMDGDLLSEQGGTSSLIGDVFFEKTVEFPLEQALLEGLQTDGHLALELHITDTRLGTGHWPDAVFSFTLEEVRQESVEKYALFYDKTTGGFLLDGYAEDGNVVLHVYPISNGAMEFFRGLSLAPYYIYRDDVAPDEFAPLTIVGEDGTAYTGRPEEEILVPSKNGLASFIFPDAPPGKYTLTLPYAYVEGYPKDAEALVWNLEDGSFSDNQVRFPGGRVQTVSIQRSEATAAERKAGVDVAWDVIVRYELDNAALEVLLSSGTLGNFPYKPGYPSDPSTGEDYGFNRSMGQPNGKDGELVFRFTASSTAAEGMDLSELKYYPTSYELRLRYNCPIELEFEVPQ